MLRRKAAADRADKVANARPASTRAAGAGGSSSTMLSMWFDFINGGKIRWLLIGYGRMNEGVVTNYRKLAWKILLWNKDERAV